MQREIPKQGYTGITLSGNVGIWEGRKENGKKKKKKGTRRGKDKEMKRKVRMRGRKFCIHL